MVQERRTLVSANRFVVGWGASSPFSDDRIGQVLTALCGTHPAISCSKLGFILYKLRNLLDAATWCTKGDKLEGKLNNTEYKFFVNYCLANAGLHSFKDRDGRQSHFTLIRSPVRTPKNEDILDPKNPSP